MKKDGHSISASDVVLMTVAVVYKFVLTYVIYRGLGLDGSAMTDVYFLSVEFKGEFNCWLNFCHDI